MTQVYEPPPPAPEMDFGTFQDLPSCEKVEADHGYELKEQISSLESFLELEPELTQFGGIGGTKSDSVDLWMMDDLPGII